MRRPISSGRVLIEDQPETARRRAADRRLAARRDPERRMRLLGRRWLDHDVIESPELSLMRKPLTGGPGLGDDSERLFEPRVGLLLRNVEAAELVVAVALADTEIEPAARHHVEHRRLLGEQHRIVPGQHHHRTADPQRFGAHRQASEQRERRGNLVPAGEVVLDQKAGAVAQCLGLDVEVEVVVESLAALGRMLAGSRLRGTEQSELHDGLSKTGEYQETAPCRRARGGGLTRRSGATWGTPCPG